MKEFADDNFKFDENGRKLLKQVENTVGKGEIACVPEASKGVIVWEWVKEKTLPEIWKIGNVTPIYKKGSKENVANY